MLKQEIYLKHDNVLNDIFLTEEPQTFYDTNSDILNKGVCHKLHPKLLFSLCRCKQVLLKITNKL